MNRLDAAERQLAELIALSSPLGLLAEGNDPVSGAPRGKLPPGLQPPRRHRQRVRLSGARAEQAAAPTREPQEAAGSWRSIRAARG